MDVNFAEIAYTAREIGKRYGRQYDTVPTLFPSEYDAMGTAERVFAYAFIQGAIAAKRSPTNN